MRDAGIGTLEICHFHFPDTDATTLRELRAALDVAGVELFSILIDMGDISNADQRFDNRMYRRSAPGSTSPRRSERKLYASSPVKERPTTSSRSND